MATKKINETEFASWSKEFWEIAETVFKDSNKTPEEKSRTSKVVSAFCTQISLKNTFALAYFNEIFAGEFEKLPEKIRKTKFNFPCDDGVNRKMTGGEWSQYLYQRVEDHHRTRVGKDIKDQDFPSIIERIKKIKGWNSDKEKAVRIMSKIFQTDKEGWDLVYGINRMNEKYFDITATNLLGEGVEITEADVRHAPYFIEDLSQTILRAKEAIENENNKEQEKPEKKKEEKKSQLKTLEGEKKELERQKKDLKEKLSNTSLDPAKRASLEEDLIENKKQREAIQARLDNLQKELKNTDNDKSNLALGLGIFAAVVVVICLIILLVRPRHRNQY